MNISWREQDGNRPRFEYKTKLQQTPEIKKASRKSVDSCISLKEKPHSIKVKKTVFKIEKTNIQDLKDTVEEVNVFLERIYKLNPSLRPRKEK